MTGSPRVSFEESIIAPTRDDGSDNILRLAERRWNRYFIRDAAKIALEHVSESGSLDDAPRLESDTRNIAGTPEIAATIFGKIDVCGAFICDVSFVGATRSSANSTKPLPNPNVLLELGYAAARIGWERIICVMNTAYGSPEDLPFDLRHRRWPVTYQLREEDSSEAKKAQFGTLAARIETALKVALQAEHAATIDIISRLDVHCLHWMHDLGQADHFQAPERRSMGEVFAFQALDAALPRLLELKALRCDVSPRRQALCISLDLPWEACVARAWIPRATQGSINHAMQRGDVAGVRQPQSTILNAFLAGSKRLGLTNVSLRAGEDKPIHLGFRPGRRSTSC